MRDRCWWDGPAARLCLLEYARVFLDALSSLLSLASPCFCQNTALGRVNIEIFKTWGRVQAYVGGQADVPRETAA